MKQSNNTYQKPLQICEDTGKVVFANEDLANQSMQFINMHKPKGDKKLLSVYACSHCEGFHLTSQESEYVPMSKPVVNTHRR